MTQAPAPEFISSVAGESVLPLEVERFVVECIPSVVHLEALLLLRSRAQEELPLETVATLLYVEPARAAKVLWDLSLRHLISARSQRGPYRFMPRPDRRASIDRLAEAHRTMLIPLTRFIHEVAEHRSIRDFANAFRFRKE